MPNELTLICKTCVAVFGVPELSVTVTVTLVRPGEPVGVPLSSPAEVRLKPAGSVPVVTAKLYGLVPPAAASE